MPGTYSFTIPANAVGTNDETEVVFDRGFTRNANLRVLTSSFGDGYEQRVVDGLNPKEEKINASFNNRPAEEIDLISEYFESMAGKALLITITNAATGTTESVKAVVESYNVVYLYDVYRSLTTVLRRVYEP